MRRTAQHSRSAEGISEVVDALEKHRAWCDGTERGRSRRRARLAEEVRDGLREALIEAATHALGAQIDEAFGGQPFLPDVPPDAPANRRRFNTYLEELKQVTNLLGQAVELWLLTCGMKHGDDWVPLIIEDMRLRAQRRDGTAKPSSGPLN